jgi:DNA-binding MarR family transcriptional regulator
MLRSLLGLRCCWSNYMASAPATSLLTPEELTAWRGFLRAHTALTRALDAQLAARHGLPLSSYEVLLFLADAPEGRMRMSELARSVVLSRSGLTRLVDRLERDGLLERAECPEDARGFYATITERGRRAFDEARATHLAGVRELFLSRFSPDEQRRLGELFGRLEI